MILIKKFDSQNLPLQAERENIASFLFNNLQQYGDPFADIEKCIDYALQVHNTPGGFVLATWDGKILTGVVIVNKTGMQGYIPENILVYIATHVDYRGMGIGKKLMTEAIRVSEGDIALHVEADNPAKKLYENLGFTNKYLEMRLTK
ncbi:MAG: GNAT family N-acetyltransferase [Bacteroidota bacterium]